MPSLFGLFLTQQVLDYSDRNIYVKEAFFYKIASVKGALSVNHCSKSCLIESSSFFFCISEYSGAAFYISDSKFDIKSVCVYSCTFTVLGAVVLSSGNSSSSLTSSTFSSLDQSDSTYYLYILQSNDIKMNNLNFSLINSANAYLFLLFDVKSITFDYNILDQVKLDYIYYLEKSNAVVSNSLILARNNLYLEPYTYSIYFIDCYLSFQILIEQFNESLFYNCYFDETYDHFIAVNLTCLPDYGKLQTDPFIIDKESLTSQTFSQILNQKIVNGSLVSITIKESVFSNLYSHSNGGAMEITNSRELLIQRSSFFDCRCVFYGAAIYVSKVETLNMSSCCIERCGSDYLSGTVINEDYKLQFLSLNINNTYFAESYTSLISTGYICSISTTNISKNYNKTDERMIAINSFSFESSIMESNTYIYFLDSNTFHANQCIFSSNKFSEFSTGTIKEHFTKCYFSNNIIESFVHLNITYIDTFKNSYNGQSKLPFPIGNLTFQINNELQCYVIERHKNYTTIILVCSIVALVVIVITLVSLVYYFRRKARKQEQQMLLSKSILAEFG